MSGPKFRDWNPQHPLGISKFSKKSCLMFDECSENVAFALQLKLLRTKPTMPKTVFLSLELKVAFPHMRLNPTTGVRGRELLVCFYYF